MARRAEVAESPRVVRAVGAGVAVVALALLVLLLVRARPAPDPLDPRSGRPDGARGLVLTLDSAGGDITDTRTVPSPARIDDTRLLVLVDRLDPDQRSDVLDFVEAGGVVVVADPDSSLHGGSGIDGGSVPVGAARDTTTVRVAPDREANIRRGGCSIGALSDLRGVFVRDGVMFPVGPEESQCLTDGPREADLHSFVIVREIGDGLVVGLGDNQPFTNRDLRFADNAGLAVSLLVPERDSDVVIVIGTGGATGNIDDVGSGDDTLSDLVPTGVWIAFVLGAISFVVFATARGVRLGGVRTEPLATSIAGSELVSATGNLMQRAKHSHRAGRLLRDRLRRDLCRAHGLPVTAPAADIDDAVTRRCELEPGLVRRLLETDTTDENSLTAFAASVHRVRRAALADSTPTSDSHSSTPDSAEPSDERLPTS